MTKIFRADPGHSCVPTALQALTGEDMYAVIYPAINRKAGEMNILEPMKTVRTKHFIAVLDELGYKCRPSKDKKKHKISYWATVSRVNKYPHPIMVQTQDHVAAIFEGKVYDAQSPFGGDGEVHSWRDLIVTHCWMVIPK
jgi:hypothetical protein